MNGKRSLENQKECLLRRSVVLVVLLLSVEVNDGSALAVLKGGESSGDVVSEGVEVARARGALVEG